MRRCVLGRAARALLACLGLVLALAAAAAAATPPGRNNKRPSSPAVEAALRVKRLAQLKREGGSYHDYLTEQRRLSPEGGAKSEEEMRAVVQYKEDEERLVEQLQRKRICFLPDCSVYPERRWFYPQLYRPERLSAVATFAVESFFDMPNVFEFMTKRYEVQWLTHMRSLSPSLAEFDCVIAHGTSAEAPAPMAAIYDSPAQQLAQLKREGGSYQDHLTEQRRLSPEGGAKSEEEMRAAAKISPSYFYKEISR